MADAAGPETKAPRPTASDGDCASTRASVPPPAVAQQQTAPAPLPAADDDEQVERFYELLANIRALRGLYSAGRGTKRPREAEAPWRPAFRMEDFEEGEEVSLSRRTAADEDARCAVVKQGTAGTTGGGGKRPAATRARAAVAEANGREEDEVAGEAHGRRGLGRRVAARG